MFKGVLHASSKQVVYLFETLAVILAIMVGAGYFVSTGISERQSEVSAWLTDYIDYPVDVAEIDIAWSGLVPRVRVQGVIVQPTKTDEIRIAEAQLGLDIYESAKQRTLIFSKVSVSGVQLPITRYAIDGFSALGKEWQADGMKKTPDLAWLSALQKVTLRDIALAYQDDIQPHLSGQYVLKSGVLKHVVADWVWQSELDFPRSLGGEIGFHGRLNQAKEPAVDWQFVAKEIDAIVFQDKSFQGLKLTQGKADIRLTGTAQNWVPHEIQGKIALSDVALASATKQEITPVAIKSVVSQLDWQQQTASGTIMSALQMNDVSEVASQWSFEQTSDGEQVLSVDAVALAVVNDVALLSDGLLSDEMREQLSTQKPTGQLQDFSMQYHPREGLKKVAFNISDGALLPWQKTPGITGLTARVNADGEQGVLELSSTQLAIKPIGTPLMVLDALTGKIQWQTTDKGMRWQHEDVRLKNADFDLFINGSVTQEGDDIINDLAVDLANIDVVKWQNYINVKHLDPDFYAWAKNAFVAGKVRVGKLLWQGSLADFPYNKPKQKGVFDIKLDVEKVRLHYAPDWPDLMNVTGNVHIRNNTLTVDSQQGEIAGFDISTVTTKITDLINRKAKLTLSGTMQGETAQAFKFLQTSPLKSKFGAYVAGVESAGSTVIDLGLDIPLIDVMNMQVTGTAQFNQSQLLRRDLFGVPLTDIYGKLAFTKSGLTAKGLQGKLLGMPVQVDVATKGEGNKTITTVDAKGRLTVGKVAEVLGEPLPDFMAGETDYTVQVAIQELASGEFETRSTITSDLVGVSLDMPAPLGKIASQNQQFGTTIAWLQNGTENYTSHYGKAATIAAQKQQDKWRGEIRLGESKAALPDAGWRVRGEWPSLAATHWQVWLDKQPDNDKNIAIEDVAVQFGELNFAGHTLHDLSLSTHKASKVWVVQLASEEVAGKVHWPIAGIENQPLEANLKYLHVTLPEVDETETVQKHKADLWPPIKLHCDKLTLDGLDLGAVDLVSHRDPTAWVLDSATLTGPAHFVEASGRWTQDAQRDETAFLITGKSDDSEVLLRHFGFQPVVKTDLVDVSLDLAWPGSPISFSSETIKGKMSVDIAQGQLLEVDPGAAGRVFGLFSFATLPRRLSLDFSDLFSKGFGFNFMKGDFNVASGHAMTDNSWMHGPAADIQITGRIGLSEKDYDQQILVTPNLASSLPLAGAAAGGAVGLGLGTAVLLADKAVKKVFGRNVINLIQYRYALGGTWDKPIFSDRQKTEKEIDKQKVQRTIGNQ